MAPSIATTVRRRRIAVQGIVQGVGFRPFVYGQALRCGLAGFVLNDSAGVTIEVEGAHEALAAFERALRAAAPPLARVDSIAVEEVPPRGETVFAIAHSRAGPERRTLIAPDTATCEDCLREVLDPADRRYRYPFTNCTNCGPRFTIVQDVPYDREKTTMRVFPMCDSCRAEYENPLDRRFHAQPNACPACGPALELQIADRRLQLEIPQPATCDLRSAPRDPIDAAAYYLARGAILAIKGLGGYHLACDPCDTEAVARLRQRKRREAKPFALMAADLEEARRLCAVSDAEAALLLSRRRPIVLLRRAPGCVLAPDVAPGYDTLGVMLPYTPLHHLLLRAFAAASGPARPAALVMTSGNLSDEPIAYRDDDARARLAPIADGTLAHNRAIHMRCDDSVSRIVAGGEQLVRRSRGYAPEPIPLAFACPVPLLACGGHLKNTFCLGKGKQAFVSHHIGDLDNLETLQSFREGIAHFQRLFDISPEAVAHDMHPDYASTRFALEMQHAKCSKQHAPCEVQHDHDDGAGSACSIVHAPLCIPVQHHHAHIASVLAEHGIEGPLIGVAADGTGYGTDGAIWGCEVMAADLCGFERLLHLAYVPLPGGEQAVRQPWRMAAACLSQTYGAAFEELEIPFVRQLDRRWRALAQMIARGINSPPTSSLGRLFDAVAALLLIRGEVQYEGQAAIELEMLAEPSEELYPFAIGDGRPATLDAAPLIRAIVEDLRRRVPAPCIAGRFHRTMAELLAAACVRAREITGLRAVALSGGSFQNRLLLERLVARLEELGFQVYLNRRVPPNDGGLSFGQLAVAAAQLRQKGAGA
ncbi:MAG TPA: carbamoyltransferase HypF [Roseiflexaceae bacterium]|nr:carbamoyltransferase HypF [Roseiflexaceae bacterium]